MTKMHWMIAIGSIAAGYFFASTLTQYQPFKKSAEIGANLA